MDNQAYLNQISNNLNSSSQKTKFSFSNFLSPKLIIFFVAAAISFIIIVIIGNIINGSNSNIKNTTISLNLHTNNLTSTISTYQPNLKSSELRGYSASLSNILSETSSILSNYIEKTYKIKQINTYDASLTETETSLSESINNELFSAKINGILDRTYAHTMAYEITIITAHEYEIFNSLDDDMKTSIESSYNSLSNLYDKFNNFSES